MMEEVRMEKTPKVLEQRMIDFVLLYLVFVSPVIAVMAIVGLYLVLTGEKHE